MEHGCRLGFRGLAIQDAQRRVLGRDVVPLVGSRVGDMLGMLGLLAGSRSASDIQSGLGGGSPANDAAGVVAGLGIDVPKANGTGRHGWWCGCARLCPISVGWTLFVHGSTIILGEVNHGSVPVGHARGMGKIHEGGDKEIQRRALRLYWPASRYASVYD